MPSKFERKMISLPSRTCSRDHWKQKLHKRKTVGRKEFPGWHYLVDVEDNQTENDVPRDIYVEGCHHQDPCWYYISFYHRAECLDEPIFLSVHICLDHVLMKSWCSYLRSHTCFILSTFTSSLNVFCLPYTWGLEVGPGDLRRKHKAAHRFWLHSCWRSSIWPIF